MSGRGNKRPVPYTCRHCGKAGTTIPSVPRKFCSRACKHVALTGPNCAAYKHGKSATSEMGSEYSRRFFGRHPGRRRVKDAVKDAIRKGVLVKQSCEMCGAVDVHAHHDDYRKPLNVRWLCPSHHRYVHRQLRASGVQLPQPVPVASTR
jgi:hypothetical protein